MISCAERPRDGNIGTSQVTVRKREALLNRDKLVIGEALALLNRPALPPSDWYILEGHSQPDVFLQTPEVIVVIEGKRTERGPTVRTTWMPGRDQMMRHIDCAWEIRGTRKVFGFYLVEGDGGAEAVAVPQTVGDAAQDAHHGRIAHVEPAPPDEGEREEIRELLPGGGDVAKGLFGDGDRLGANYP